MRGKKIIRRIGIGCLGLVVVLVGLLTFTGPGRDLLNLWRHGAIQGMLFSPADRKYSADAEGNLKAIRTALMLYHNSEGQFPVAGGWMNAIENRLTASDMSGSESQKKLVRPDLQRESGSFGYALSDQAAGKYKDDLGPHAVLVYESKQTVKNAHGNPETDRNGLAITVDGTILKP